MHSTPVTLPPSNNQSQRAIDRRMYLNYNKKKNIEKYKTLYAVTEM